MPASAPRIDSRLLAALEQLDRRGRPIAETHRRLGDVADRLGLTRPSYQQIRVLLQAMRAGRRPNEVATALLDLAFQVRSPHAVARSFVYRS